MSVALAVEPDATLPRPPVLVAEALRATSKSLSLWKEILSADPNHVDTAAGKTDLQLVHGRVFRIGGEKSNVDSAATCRRESESSVPAVPRSVAAPASKLYLPVFIVGRRVRDRGLNLVCPRQSSRQRLLRRSPEPEIWSEPSALDRDAVRARCAQTGI